MTALQLAWAMVKDRTATTFLTIVTLAVGVATLLAVLLVTDQVGTRLKRDAEGIDLVVGDKGSPVQLILSSVFHLQAPTGAVPLGDIEKLRTHPLVAWSVPIGLGDSFKGYRIVGTEQKFIFLYDGVLEQGGNYWGTPFDAVLGADVARRTGLDIGDRFRSVHGLATAGAGHGQEYVVTGVLKRTGRVIDRLVLTGLQSLWNAHIAPDGSAPPAEVSALLVRYKSPQAAVQLPHFIHHATNMQAAVPKQEAARLMTLLEGGFAIARSLAVLLIAASILGILVTLFSSMAERHSDVAMMRVMGGTQRRIFGQIVLEGVLLAACGSLAGFLACHAGLALAGWTMPVVRDSGITGFAVIPGEMLVLAGTVVLGTLAAVLPALQASRVDIMSMLSKD